MTAICASHYRNPLNDYVGKKHHHKNRFRQRQSSRSAFYQPGLKVIESHNHNTTNSNNDSDSDSSFCCDETMKPQQSSQTQSIQQSQSQSTTPEGHWGFRPSALQYDDYGRGDMSVSEIVDCYIRDNERAEKEGVSIPPRPSISQNSSNSNGQHHHDRKLRGVKDALFSASSSALNCSNNNTPLSSSTSVLRCLQWNIQAFSSPKDERNMHTVTAGIIRSIFETDSDVLVLNEIHWREVENNNCTGHSNNYSSYHCEPTRRAIRSSQTFLEEVLRLRGYHYSRVASHGDTPTMIATRNKVLESKELVLSHNRSALCLLIETPTSSSANGKCWVVGTHLDAFDAAGRRSEITTLLREAQNRNNNNNTNVTKNVPILIAGDFNQQRSRDYSPSEWKRVACSADLRGVPVDDGVSGILEKAGFRCILDDVRKSESNNSNTAVACNWNQAQPPPSTHWSGTTIDYTYYSNQHHHNGNESDNESDDVATTSIAPHGVYVGRAGFSDHRMTVTDWTLTTIAPSSSATKPDSDTGPQPRHIDKSFFFHHLPAGRHHSWRFSYHNTIPPAWLRKAKKTSSSNSNDMSTKVPNPRPQHATVA